MNRHPITGDLPHELGSDRATEVAFGSILTFTGRYVNPLTCDPEDIDIKDIAHALSMQCRYAGHISQFYSVAQHSVLVAMLCPLEKGLVGLLHDAEEAYLLDMPSPIKKNPIFDGYRAAGKRLRQVIFRAFAVPYELYDEKVKAIDDQVYRWERRSFWHQAADIVPLSPPDAEAAFLDQFHRLHELHLGF